MDKRFENYVNEQIKCLFDGNACTAIFYEKSVKFLANGGANELADIQYANIENMYRGTFPNSASVYFKDKGNIHSVQTFKTTRFMEYIKWGIEASKKTSAN